jgi:hypothetical protein
MLAHFRGTSFCCCKCHVFVGFGSNTEEMNRKYFSYAFCMMLNFAHPLVGINRGLISNDVLLLINKLSYLSVKFRV